MQPWTVCLERATSELKACNLKLTHLQEAAAKKGEEKFFQDESSAGKTKVSEGHVQDQKKVRGVASCAG